MSTLSSKLFAALRLTAQLRPVEVTGETLDLFYTLETVNPRANPRDIRSIPPAAHIIAPANTCKYSNPLWLLSRNAPASGLPVTAATDTARQRAPFRTLLDSGHLCYQHRGKGDVCAREEPVNDASITTPEQSMVKNMTLNLPILSASTPATDEEYQPSTECDQPGFESSVWKLYWVRLCGFDILVDLLGIDVVVAGSVGIRGGDATKTVIRISRAFVGFVSAGCHLALDTRITTSASPLASSRCVDDNIDDKSQEMVGQKVIDLSLSTDEEGPQNYIKASEPTISTNEESGYISLSPHLQVHSDGPQKRRKLSPKIPLHREPASNRSSFKPVGYLSSLPPVSAKDAFKPIVDDDPIVWTSSPKPERPKQKLKLQIDKEGWASLSDSDGSLPDKQWLRTAQQRPAGNPNKSQGTTGLGSQVQAPKAISLSSRHLNKISPVSAVDSQLDSSEDDRPRGKTSKRPTGGKPKATNHEKAERAQEKEKARAAAKAAKEREKEEDKERKLLLKEERAREKQKEKDLAEANKLKLDKKLSTPEMIVDLPISIEGSTVDTQIREMLKQIGVDVVSYDGPVPNVIKWRRKVDYRFDARSNCREKLRVQETDSEKHVMCLISAKELADLVASGSSSGDAQKGLDEHVARTKRAFGACKLIYMIEGLDIWMRKSRNARNRAFTAAVQGQFRAPEGSENATNSSSTTATSKRKQQQQRTGTVDEDTIEDALLRLQVVHNCLIHHAAASVETAEWVAHFTEQISQIPYR
ncbi:MAG: hypothetical protein Q9173_002847, partial [Seirophora scorigena]